MRIDESIECPRKRKYDISKINYDIYSFFDKQNASTVRMLIMCISNWMEYSVDDYNH